VGSNPTLGTNGEFADGEASSLENYDTSERAGDRNLNSPQRDGIWH